MRYLKTQNISKHNIADRTLIVYPEGVGPGNRIVMGVTGGLMLPKGGTGTRPQASSIRTPDDANGTIRFNTDTNSIEAYINDAWQVVTAPATSAITKQTLGPGDYATTIFGPLTQTPTQDDAILVFVENVFQISVTNYNILYNYLGSGNAYIEFTSPVPLDKYITILFGFSN